MTDELESNLSTAAFAVPADLSFEQAMAVTQDLLEQGMAGTIAPAAVQTAIATLVATENGARGFFVVSLSDDRPWLDHLLADSPASLATAPAIVSPLLIKNLAMSTAMGIAHRRNQDEATAQGSDRVHSRTLALIQALLQQPQASPHLRDQAEQLLASLATDSGTYHAFLSRWGYDADQKQAMGQAIHLALGTLP
jgi:hypothetical protein